MWKIGFIRFLERSEKEIIKLLVLGSLFFVAVFVVYTNERAAEGEYFTKSNEYRVVYLAHRRANEARHQQHASKDA